MPRAGGCIAVCRDPRSGVAYTTLISVEELSKLSSVQLVDARAGTDAREAYAREHLAGAAYVDLEHDMARPVEDPARGGRHPLPSIEIWRKRVGELGIDPAIQIVVYDEADGSMAAARFWWMMRASGHRAVAVLNGGLQAARTRWPLESGPTRVAFKQSYPVANWSWPIVGLEEVKKRSSDPEWRIIDVRSVPRYRGDVEPLDPVAGHIPGARNVPYTDNLDQTGLFKKPLDLEAHYRAALVGFPTDRVIVHCGSGVTACHTALALAHAGLGRASVYVGSWSEWSRNDLPIARGDEPNTVAKAVANT
jgi:thiosulfate/3-mercaptopyruvate sulfurtransferase